MNRRELLGSLGVASAASLVWAFGCGGPVRSARQRPERLREVRSWLRDAVSRLAASYPAAHALAVAHRHTPAATDVMRTASAQARHTGVVFRVRDRSGNWREHATGDLSREGIIAATRALVASTTRPAAIEFGPPPPPIGVLAPIPDVELRNRVDAIMRHDQIRSSRIVYAAALIEVDDVTVWSVAPGHDREHRTRRVLERATRAAWNGTRPVVCEVQRGWTGGLAANGLDEATVTTASRRVLMMMSPGSFSDGEHDVVLDPSVVAIVVDAITRGLLTSDAIRRPEVARRCPIGATIAASSVSLTDDPTAPASYGGFAFDDEGVVSRPITLLDVGRVVARLGDQGGGRSRRLGHHGPIAARPSHLVLTPGTTTLRELGSEGWVLEGGSSASFDPSTDRLVVDIALAKELRRGAETGRVFSDLQLSAELTSLLTAITAIGSEAQTLALRDEHDGLPCWRSISAPWLATRGRIRARRRTG